MSEGTPASGFSLAPCFSAPPALSGPTALVSAAPAAPAACGGLLGVAVFDEGAPSASSVAEAPARALEPHSPHGIKKPAANQPPSAKLAAAKNPDTCH